MKRKSDTPEEKPGKPEKPERNGDPCTPSGASLDSPQVVEAGDIQPLPVEAPRPRRRRRTKDEMDAQRAAEAEALAAEYRGQAAMIVDMADAVLAQSLPPSLEPHERAILEPALASYMQTSQTGLSPGWALFGALVVILAPRVVTAYQRYRRSRLEVVHGGLDGTDHPDSRSEGNGQNDSGPEAN